MIENILSFLTNFLASDTTASYIPLMLFVLWFFETVGFLGLFLPFEIPAVLGLARLVHEPYMFGAAWIMLFFWVFLGLTTWYFLGKTFLKNTFQNLMKKFPMFEDEIAKADWLVKKNPNRSFPVLINIWFVRPLISVYFWSHQYHHKKYIFSSFLGWLGYAIPRLIVWGLVWVFGKQILEYFSVDKKYIIWFFVLIFLISFVKEFFEEKKHEKK